MSRSMLLSVMVLWIIFLLAVLRLPTVSTSSCSLLRSGSATSSNPISCTFADLNHLDVVEIGRAHV